MFFEFVFSIADFYKEIAETNKNMAKRAMGQGVSSNLEGEMFIIRNEHGIDEVITMRNGKLNFSSLSDGARIEINFKKDGSRNFNS